MTRLAWVVAVALAVAGCSKTHHNPIPAAPCAVTGSAYAVVSCSFAGAYGCDQVSGTITNCERAALGAACAGGGGVFSDAGCSTVGTVPGLCSYADASVMTGVPVAAGAVLNEFYYSAGWSLSEAQSYCAAPPAGVWIATP